MVSNVDDLATYNLLKEFLNAQINTAGGMDATRFEQLSVILDRCAEVATTEYDVQELAVARLEELLR